MRFVPSLLKRRILPVVAALLVATVGASADTVVLDNFNDNSLNTSLWLPVVGLGAGSVAETSQRLEITAEAGGSAVGVALLATLAGDFEVMVDYALPALFNPAYETGAGIFLGTPTYPIGGFAVARDTIDGSTPLNGYVGVFPNLDSAGSDERKVQTEDESGTLRFNRTGDAMAAWYWDATEPNTAPWYSDEAVGTWVLIHKTSDFPAEPITAVDLIVVTWGAEDVFVAFDNFRLQAETVTPVPEPASVLLLGTGLLVLTRRMRRRCP